LVFGILEHEVDNATRAQRRQCPGRITGTVTLDPKHEHVSQVGFDVRRSCALNQTVKVRDVRGTPPGTPEPVLCGKPAQLLI